MEHQKVGIAADLVAQVSPLLPGFATIGGRIHADTRREIYLVGVQRIDHRAVYIVVHPWDDLESASSIRALQETPLLYANKQGIWVLRVEINVLGMGDVGRRREGPLGRIHRP